MCQPAVAKSSSDQHLSRDVLRRMLERENELRLSDEVQAMYAAVERDESEHDWIEVTENLQRELLREFSIPLELEVEALRTLRKAAREDPELCEIPLYSVKRFQRARRGDLQAQDAVVDCSMMRLDGATTTLLSELMAHGAAGSSQQGEVCGGMPLLIAAGSYS